MADDPNQLQEKILKEYEKETDTIFGKMLNVIIRVHRKIDNAAYRRTLEQLQKEMSNNGK